MGDYTNILIIILCLGVFVFVVHMYLYQIIKKKTLLYNNLKNLENKYSLKKKLPEECPLTHKCKSSNEFNKVIIDDFLQTKIETQPKLFDEIVKLNEEAREQYKLYAKEYSLLRPDLPDNFIKFKFKDLKIWIVYFYETLIYKYNKLNKFKYTETKVLITYRSPQGKVNKSKSNRYSFDSLRKHYYYVKKSIEHHSTREHMIRMERSKVTPKLRFEVFKRDNYTCSTCGRTKKDGVLLVIDHKFPVSKGGKTELNNLQTLCSDCNLGKSDSID